MPGHAIARIAVLLLLSLATVALFTLPPRYDAVGPQLLQNADLAQGLAGWETHGDATVTGGVALLQNRPGAATAALYQQPRIADAPLLRLTMEVRVADIQPGPVNWQVPRLLLVTYDRRDRPRWQVRHMAPVPGRTDRFKTFSVVAQVPHDNPHILVGAQLAAGSGRMWVRRLSLQPMKADTAFLWMRDSLLAVWLPALAWAAWPLLSAVRSRRGGLLVIGVGIAILVATLMPQPGKLWTLDQIGTMERAMMSALGWQPAAPQAASAVSPGLGGEATALAQHLDKVGHFLIHLLLGVAVALLYRRNRLWPLLVYLAVFAGLTEVLQNFSVDRDPAVTDALINYAGALTGFLPVLVLAGGIDGATEAADQRRG